MRTINNQYVPKNNYQIREINKTKTRTKIKTRLAKGLVIHRITLKSISACDATISFYLICDWYFGEFVMLTPTLNEDYLIERNCHGKTEWQGFNCDDIFWLENIYIIDIFLRIV